MSEQLELRNAGLSIKTTKVASVSAIRVSSRGADPWVGPMSALARPKSGGPPWPDTATPPCSPSWSSELSEAVPISDVDLTPVRVSNQRDSEILRASSHLVHASSGHGIVYRVFIRPDLGLHELHSHVRVVTLSSGGWRRSLSA